MFAAFLGLLLGGGVVLVFSVFVGVPRPTSTPRWMLHLSDTVTHAGISGLTVNRLVGVCAAASMLTFFTVMVLTMSWAVSGILALLVVPIPLLVVFHRANVRVKAVRGCWPDVVDQLVSGVRAGGGLAELLIQLADTGPEDLRPQFAYFAAEYRANGNFDQALVHLKARFADPVADRIIEALRLSRDVGGSDLSALLRSLAVFLREDARIRGELEARQSWTVNAARLGVAAPWVVLVLMSTRSETAGTWNTPQGVLILLLGAIICVVAYAIMVYMGRLPTDARSLR